MNLVSFSIRTKGAHNFTRRLGTVFTRIGVSEIPIRHALNSIIDTLRQYGGAPTFFIPAVVLDRHPVLISEIVHDGAEIGIHGYVLNDDRTLSKGQQYKQTKQAISVFEKNKIAYQGFRKPYLGWTEESLDVYASVRINYESNVAGLHNVVDLNAYSPLLRSGYAKSLKLFQTVPCTRAWRPQGVPLHFAFQMNLDSLPGNQKLLRTVMRTEDICLDSVVDSLSRSNIGE